MQPNTPSPSLSRSPLTPTNDRTGSRTETRPPSGYTLPCLQERWRCPVSPPFFRSSSLYRAPFSYMTPQPCFSPIPCQRVSDVHDEREQNEGFQEAERILEPDRFHFDWRLLSTPEGHHFQAHFVSVNGLMVRILPFQGRGPGSIPG